MWGEGTVLAGRYQLRQRIGGGSMGDVWRALDTVLGREVAVKILLPALLDDAGFAARFHTEARVLAALSHPGIVSVFDYGEADDPRTAFLVMELITGRPLSDLLDESAPLSEATTLTVVAQTLEALQAAHDRGIVHRDVKPANLMLRSGSVVVTDFGVARTADARRLTAADVVLGTAVYAAPEQARHTAVTAAADQYAVGVIAYECLTGTPPFDGGTPLGDHDEAPAGAGPATAGNGLGPGARTGDAGPGEGPGGAVRERPGDGRDRTAARRGGGSVTRIGVPQDSFQTGVDVAGVEAAAAAAAGARVDGDFLSFVVVPREDEGGDGADGDGGGAGAGGAGLTAAGGGAKAAGGGGGGDGGGGAGAGGGAGGGVGGGEAAASDSQEIAPAWASYAVRPQAEGTDWASFTVRGQEDETVPRPDGEPAVEAEAASAAEPESKARGKPGRVVPQDSFTAGVDIGAAAEAAEIGGAARAGVARWRSREPEEGPAEASRPAKAGFGARWRKRNAAQESAAGATGQQESKSAGTARQESQAARESAGGESSVGQRARGAAGDDSQAVRESAGIASPPGERTDEAGKREQQVGGAAGEQVGSTAGVASPAGWRTNEAGEQDQQAGAELAGEQAADPQREPDLSALSAAGASVPVAGGEPEPEPEPEAQPVA